MNIAEQPLAGQPASIDGLELIGIGTTFQSDLYDMIANAAIFNHFESEEVQQLISFMHAYAAKAGTEIFHEGNPGLYMGILIEGNIEIRKRGDDDKNRTIACITPGKTFGEMSLIDGLPHSATGVAKTAIKLTLLSKDNLRLFVERHPAAGAKMLWEISRLLSLRLRQTSHQLVDVMEA